MRNIRALTWLPTLLALTACDPRPLDSLRYLDPCAELSDVALPKQVIPLMVGGGMDEKTDPKLIQSGNLVSVIDGYRQKSGELRSRNGYAAMTKVTDGFANLAACRALFPLQGANLGMIGSLASPGTADALYVYSPTQAKWMHNTRGYQPMPMAVTTLAPVESRNLSTTTVSDLVNPDYAVAGTTAITSYVDQGGVGTIGFVLTDTQTGTTIQGAQSVGFTGQIHRVAAGGSTWLVVFLIDSAAAPGSLRAIVTNVSTLTQTTYNIAPAATSAALTFDVMSKPGSNNIMVAYSANAGGLTVLEFNPATGAVVTGPTNVATGGTIESIGWMQDRFTTGFFHVAVGDSVSGVIVKRFTGALALSSTTVVDAASLFASVITGYLLTSAPTYNVVWGDGTGVRTGAGALVVGHRLISKAFLIGAKYYVIAQLGSTIQPTAYVIAAESSTQDLGGSRLVGIIMPNASGGTYQPAQAVITSVAVVGNVANAALSRITKLTKTAITTTHQIMQASINFTPRIKGARELSGTTFFPGGMVTQYDGSSVDLATFPAYPEFAGASTGVGGSMTPSGVYQYVMTYKTIDANGRVRRSAPSIPVQVTLGAGDGSATITASTSRIGPLPNVSDPIIEFWRAGPAAAGGIVYNKVGETASFTTINTRAFFDLMSDVNAAAAELLYDPLANGGVLNNFPSPSTQLLEVLDNRVFIVSAENPTEIWPSKEYKTGQGLAFHPNLVIRITGSPITALAAMDGRLVAFQSDSLWVIPIGAGPNDQGQGTFGDPQLVSRNVGCIDPGSVVATPDGIMFQARQGIYLLTRGLDVQFIGAGIEQTMSDNGQPGFVSAALVGGTSQARFVSSANTISATIAFTWDFYFKQWFIWNLTNQSHSLIDATSVGRTFYVVDGQGSVFNETPGAFSDRGSVIAWTVGLPALAVGQLGGWFLTYGLRVIGTYEGPHTLTIQTEPSYQPVNQEIGTIVVASAPTDYQFERRVARQKSTSIQPLVTITPSGLTEGARISAMSLVVGIKPGRYPLPAARRLT